MIYYVRSRKIKIVDTFWATIFVGLKDTKKSTEETRNIIYNKEVAEYICQKYCDEFGLCVSFTPTTYIYTSNPKKLYTGLGREPGLIVQLINYPRFPDTPKNIKNHALKLGKLLQKELKQYKVTIMMPDKTIMLEEEDE